MNFQNDNNSNIHKPCTCPSPTANSLNVVQTTPSIVSVNSAIPLDTVANSNGTAISFTPPTTVLLEGGRTYLAIYEVQVIIQPGGNLIIIQSLDLVLLWDILQDSLLYQHPQFSLHLQV